jgi:hypothetical protein
MNKKKNDKIPSVAVQQLILTWNSFLARDFYKEMRDVWVKVGILVLVSNIVGILIALFMPPISIVISFPEPKIPALDPTIALPVLYTGTISVDSVILGFSAVCCFSFLRSCESTIDSKLEDLKKFDNKKKPTQKDKEWNQVIFLQWRFYLKIKNVFTRYGQCFLKISFFLLGIQTMIFCYSMISGWITIVSFLIYTDIFVLILGGVFPLLSTALSYVED